MPAWLPAAATALVGLGAGLIGHALATVEPIARPTEGRLGMERDRALGRSSLFTLCDPLVRRAARLCIPFLSPSRQTSLDGMLEQAGCFMGLRASELLGLSLVTSLASAALSLLAGSVLGAAQMLVCVGAALGALAPFLRLGNATLERNKSIARELPAAIDLAALCMGAGMDFPASLRQAVLQHRGGDSPLRQELVHMLRGLEMGQTRVEVLQRFAQLTPIVSVREFVAAVVQSEARGTPLREVLQIQASTLRMRRSVAAEEAAARAGVLLVIPLLLLLGSLLVLLIGPFIVNGFGL